MPLPASMNISSDHYSPRNLRCATTGDFVANRSITSDHLPFEVAEDKLGTHSNAEWKEGHFNLAPRHPIDGTHSNAECRVR